jgi:hypothetical protein
MTEDLLKSFQQAYRNLELLPLIEENDLRRFRGEHLNFVRTKELMVSKACH